MNVLSRLLWLLVWLGLGLYLAFTLWLGFAGLAYPFQLDYGEGIVLWFTQQLARGHSIYKGMTGFPYASSNYPPVAMLLPAALTPIFGDGYAAGRLLNFASALVVAALIYRIVRAETRTARAGALATLFFIGSPYIYHWVPLFRADLLGLAFAFGGVYVVWLWERTGSRQQASFDSAPLRSGGSRQFCLLLAACCLLLAALYTKHTLFAAPLAAFLAIWGRDKRPAVAFAFALSAIGGAIYLTLDAATGGGFTFGLITSNATLFLPEQLSALLRNFVTTFPILLLLALWGWVHRVRAGQMGVLEWYAVTASASLVMAGRVGAWENYFFEAIAVVCVLAFANLKDGIRNTQPVLRSAYSVTLLKRLVGLILLLLQLALMWHDPRTAANLIAEDLPANRELAALLARTSGMILSEDMGALATSGKQVAYYTFQYSSLGRSGKWDQSWELNGLRDGAFPLVILERGTREDVDRYRRFTRQFVSTLDRYYARVQTLGKYEVYTPAPPLLLQAVNFGDEIAMVGWSIQPSNLQSLILRPFDSAQGRLRSGQVSNLQLSIVWQARRAMTQRYTAFVHLEKVDGGKVAQDDHEPRGGIYPTTRWAAGEMVREVYTLNVPGSLAPGKYVLRVGWYDAETGERLSVPGSADDAVTIAEWRVASDLSLHSGQAQ